MIISEAEWVTSQTITVVTGNISWHLMKAHLGSEVECGLYMFMLGTWSTPWVVELKTLITETRPAVSTAFSGLHSLRGLTELTHHRHAAQTYCVPVPERQSTSQSVTVWPYKLCHSSNKQSKNRIQKKHSVQNINSFPNQPALTQWYFHT